MAGNSTTSKKSTSQKEKLELEEKKIDIEKKKTEVRKEQLEIAELQTNRKRDIEEQKAIIDKLSELRTLLSESTVDSDKTILGSEPFQAPIIEGRRREVVLEKVMELVGKLS